LNRIRSISLFLAALALVGSGCGRTPKADPAEQARIAEWQLMASAARVPRALEELRQRANSGLVEAQSALGQALCQQSDPALAQEGLTWLRRAAAANDARALLTLGKLELSGESRVTQDYAAARAHLVASAEQHEPRASYYLGLMARSGYGGAEDHLAAAKYLAVAADAGIPQAMFMLANAYRNGDGVPRDEPRALALYEKAAEHDHPESIQALAMAYQNGELGLARDPARSESEQMELAHAQKHAPPRP
jgi:TPR repeat protein